MLGILFGTMCAIALVGLRPLGRGFHGHPHHGHHGCGHGRWSGRSRHGHHHREGRRGRRGAFTRAAGEMFKRKLDLDEDQADLVDHALGDLRDAVKDLGIALQDGKQELARAFAGDDVDDATLAAIFASQDEDVARFRRSAVSALKQIHAVLEPDQREEATAWLARFGGVAS